MDSPRINSVHVTIMKDERDTIMQSKLVNDQELRNGKFLYDSKASCFARNKTPEDWIEHVHDLYRDYRGRIIDHEGHEIILNMNVFEVPFIREWFRDFACTPCLPGVRPRIRTVARPRVRVLLTIIRARFPEEAEHWGSREAANDNQPPDVKLHKP